MAARHRERSGKRRRLSAGDIAKVIMALAMLIAACNGHGLT